jgi:hypothetical protein
MAENATVDMLYDIVAEGGGDFHSLKTTLDKAPQPVMDALMTYVAAGNFEMSDVDNDAYKGMWFDDDREFWLFTFSGTDPDPFGGTVIIGATAPNVIGVVGDSFIVED